MEFFIFEKANNSIGTKMQVNLLNNRDKKLNCFSAQHNSMTKLCCALFKYENERKIS